MSEAAAKAPAKGGSKKLMLIAVAVLVLGGGAGAYWFTRGDTAKAKGKAHAEDKNKEDDAHGEEGDEHGEDAKDEGEEEDEGEETERGLVAFDPFVVNLADPSGTRFLRTTVQLVVRTPDEAAEFEHSKVMLMQARSAILDLLTQQTADRLVTPEGKTEVREAIKKQVGKAVHGVKVVDVLFSDFVVQF